MNFPGIRCGVLALVLLFRPIGVPLNAQSASTTELTVFAAASLTEAFQALGKNFEATHPSTKFVYNFGGSQQLVQQIVQGAEADIFASASLKQMTTAVSHGVIDTPRVRVFARNRLVLILPKENPGDLHALTDLAKQNIKVVLADSSVPVGQYALQMLDRCSKSGEFRESFRSDVLRNVVSYEENVRAVLSKVQLGECDAGIVYSSDLVHDSTGQVQRIDIPDRLNVIAEYPVAIVRGTKSPQRAGEFLNYILSVEGQRVLSSFGFIEVSPAGRR